jgi:hypothetical protein
MGSSARLRRRDGLKRIAPLLDELRALGGLRELRPGNFLHGSHPILHFHYPADGQIVADLRLPDGRVTRFDVSAEDGQQELLAVIEGSLD